MGYSAGDFHANAEIQGALNDDLQAKRFIYCHHVKEKNAEGLKNTELYTEKELLIETKEY